MTRLALAMAVILALLALAFAPGTRAGSSLQEELEKRAAALRAPAGAKAPAPAAPYQAPAFLRAVASATDDKFGEGAMSDLARAIHHIGVTFAAMSFAIYFLPTFVALGRGHRSWFFVLLIDLFFAWTFIGWLVALLWSFSQDTRANYRREQRLAAVEKELAHVSTIARLPAE